MYVGGMFPCELSMYAELTNNPNFTALFCGDGSATPDALSKINYKTVGTKAELKSLQESFKPDLTLYRTWSGTENFVGEDDVLWVQEIYPSGSVEEAVNNDCGVKWHKKTAYQSKPRAERFGQYWLPYCVSRHWEKRSQVKDIPVLVATCLPPDASRILKTKSFDILVKPILDYDPNIIHIYTGFYGGLEQIPYVAPHLKKSFHPLEVNKYIARAQIWISPTSIWYNEGCISQKTLVGLACGTLTITNNYIGMEDVFGKDGENIVYANSPEETLDKVKYYLVHQSERERIAHQGYEFVHNEYNWEKHLFRLYGGINDKN